MTIEQLTAELRRKLEEANEQASSQHGDAWWEGYAAACENVLALLAEERSK